MNHSEAPSLVAETEKVSKTKWKLAVLLSVGLAIDMMSRLAIYSVLPLLRKELIASDVLLGLIVASFPWTYGLLSPIAGYVGDHMPRRTVVIASMAAWSIACAMCGIASGPWQLFVLRVVLGAAQVCYMPTANAYLADFHGADTRGKASGLYQAGGYVGIFLAGLPAAFVASHLGWRAMLVLCGILGLIVAAVMWRQLPAPKRSDAPRPLTPAKSLFEEVSPLLKPSVLAIVGSFSLISMVFWILFTYLPLFIYEHYKVSLESAAFQASFYIQASAFILMPFLSAASDAWAAGRDRNRFLVCAMASALGIPALIGVGWGSSSATLIGSLVLFGLVMAATDASWLPMLCTVTRAHERALGYGLMNTFATLAGGCAAMITALVMKRLGLGTVIGTLSVLFAFMVLLMVLIAFCLLKRDKVQEADLA